MCCCSLYRRFNYLCTIHSLHFNSRGQCNFRFRLYCTKNLTFYLFFCFCIEATRASSKGKPDSTSSNQQTTSGGSNKALVAPEGGTFVSNNLRSFSFNDLKNAAKNFRSESLLGEGGFGCVFKGWIDENTYAPCKPGTGMVVAIKKLKAESFQGHREWLVC